MLLQDKELTEFSEDELAEIRLLVRSGVCPICGAGEFKNVALHICLKHGVTRRELSEMVGFTFSESICSKALSDRLRVTSADKRPCDLGTPPPTKNVSSKGREVMRRNGLKGMDSISKETRRKNGLRAGAAKKGIRTSLVSHGTFAEYGKGCRCEACQEAMRAYWREWRYARKTGNKPPSKLNYS